MARKLAVVLVAALATLMTGCGGKGQPSEDAHGRAAERELSEPGLRAHRRRNRGRRTRRHDCDLPWYATAKGPGTPGTSVLTIHKDLTLRGAGADQVTIEPRSVGEKRIAEDNPDIRNGKA